MLLLYFIFLGLNSLVKNEKLLYAFALTGLFMTNLRGIYCVLALSVIHLLFLRYYLIENKNKLALSYLISIVVFISFLIYQYQLLDWVIITKHPTDSTHRKAASLMRIFKNAAAFIKNYLDYGRIFYWIPIVVFLALSYIKRLEISNDLKLTLIPIVSFTTIFFIGMVPFSNPMEPRYFLVNYLLGIMLFLQIIDSIDLQKTKKRGIILLTTSALLSGHFWIYPATIAQGWDSSFAYLKYFSLEKQMIDYIEKEKLDISLIGTYFPLNSRNATYALASNNNYENFARPDIKSNAYYLFSNIENSTEDEVKLNLEKDWSLVKEVSEMGVF